MTIEKMIEELEMYYEAAGFKDINIYDKIFGMLRAWNNS